MRRRCAARAQLAGALDGEEPRHRSGHGTPTSTGIRQSLMGPDRSPAIEKSPVRAGLLSFLGRCGGCRCAREYQVGVPNRWTLAVAEPMDRNSLAVPDRIRAMSEADDRTPPSESRPVDLGLSEGKAMGFAPTSALSPQSFPIGGLTPVQAAPTDAALPSAQSSGAAPSDASDSGLGAGGQSSETS